MESQLASRQDIAKLEKQIEKTESTLRLELADIRKEQAVQRWMLTITVGGIVALIAKDFFRFSLRGRVEQYSSNNSK